MEEDPAMIVAPADSRVLLGSLSQHSRLFLKEKFFTFPELLGMDKTAWLQTFGMGDFAIFRLTPEKYHYNHVPVAGEVRDFYEIPGLYHSCNPAAVVLQATPYSKNKRVVTIIDTDVEGGSRAGFVAMIEVVALMIGEVCQCYSKARYDQPQEISPGMFLLKGQPKSLFRPGSSTVVLIFEPGKIGFAEDLIANANRQDLHSRFSLGFDKRLGETEVRVRSAIARANQTRANRRNANDQ
jgi:phosphatidylserine decarboxylase